MSYTNTTFLIPYDLTNKIAFLRDPLRTHYEKIIRIEPDMIPSIIEMRSFEFKSLVNYTIAGLNNVETKEIVLNDVEYWNIFTYVNKSDIPVEPNFESDIERFREDNKEDKNPIKQILFTVANKNNKEFYVLGELLKIVNYYNSNKKKIILVVSHPVKTLIEAFSKQTEFMIDSVNFACYDEPFEIFKELLSPLSYYTKISKYIIENEFRQLMQNFDELWFARMLEELDCKLFKSKLIEYKTICDAATTFNNNVGLKEIDEKKLEKFRDELKNLNGEPKLAKGEEIKSCESRIEGKEKDIKSYVDEDKPKYREVLVNDAINPGFLTIQENIISQLEYLL